MSKIKVAELFYSIQDFTESKYSRWYEQLVVRAQTRSLPEDTYYEKHHIFPRSFGGSNKKINIVKLTAREHFICHWLLVKMLPFGVFRSKMYRALSFMKAINHDNQKRYSTAITSRVYEKIKPEVVKIQAEAMTGRVPSEQQRKKMSIAMKGRKQTEEHRKNSSLARKGKSGHKWTEEQREKIVLHIKEHGGSMRGKNHTEEAKQKMSVFRKGKPNSEEHNRKISEAHCGKRLTEYQKEKFSRLGWKHSEETKKKMSESRKGKRKPLSDDTKKKISASSKGKIPWNKGLKGKTKNE